MSNAGNSIVVKVTNLCPGKQDTSPLKQSSDVQEEKSLTKTSQQPTETPSARRAAHQTRTSTAPTSTSTRASTAERRTLCSATAGSDWAWGRRRRWIVASGVVRLISRIHQISTEGCFPNDLVAGVVNWRISPGTVPSLSCGKAGLHFYV